MIRKNTRIIYLKTKISHKNGEVTVHESNILPYFDDSEMIIAVVGIAGTTEEGAIDPIHKILEIRKIFEQEKNRAIP